MFPLPCPPFFLLLFPFLKKKKKKTNTLCDLDQLPPFALYESFAYLVGLDVCYTYFW